MAGRSSEQTPNSSIQLPDWPGILVTTQLYNSLLISDGDFSSNMTVFLVTERIFMNVTMTVWADPREYVAATAAVYGCQQKL